MEVTPSSAEVQVGQAIQMQARAVGADGQPVPAARIRWFANGNGGTVDSTGLVKGGFIGTTQITAVAVVPGTKNALGSAVGPHRARTRRAGSSSWTRRPGWWPGPVSRS